MFYSLISCVVHTFTGGYKYRESVTCFALLNSFREAHDPNSLDLLFYAANAGVQFRRRNLQHAKLVAVVRILHCFTFFLPLKRSNLLLVWAPRRGSPQW